MTNSKALTFICMAIALSTACNKSSSSGPTVVVQPQVSTNVAKRYHLKGKVVSIDKQSKMASVDSEPIPGFMDAMTMPYTVKPESELDHLKPGDAITADVVVQNEKAWLENINVTDQATRPASK